MNRIIGEPAFSGLETLEKAKSAAVLVSNRAGTFRLLHWDPALTES